MAMMMRTVISGLCIVACAARSFRSNIQVNDEHPIVKVITLLKGLGEKAKAEGETEEISYTKFEYWCKTSKSTLNADISERKDNLDSLESSIEAKSGEVTALTAQISTLNDQILAHTTTKGQAANNRRDANGLYTLAEKDYADTIKACKDCIVALEAAYEKTEGASSLLNFRRAQSQVRELLGFLEIKATAEQLSSVHDFLGIVRAPNNTDFKEVKAKGDNEAHIDVYKFKSNSVIELLKALQAKFEEEKLAADNAETNALNAHALQTQSLDAAIKAAEADRDAKNTILGDTEKALGADKGEKELEEEALSGSEGTLKSTTQACTLKESEWQERSEIRKSEIAAIEAAIGILSKVSGVRTEAPKNPTLTFVQLDEHPQDSKAKAVQLLRAVAKTTHSKALERLAMAIAAKSSGIHYNKPGAFDEIINMIQKMIYKLQADQTSEDKHKDWCDKELEKTATSISDKSDKKSELSAKIGALEATEGLLTGKIEKDMNLIKDITAKMKEMTEIRQVGKKENAISVKDAEDAVEAIAEATAVLTEFYKSSGAVAKQPWEFLQAEPAVELPANPQTWGSSYTAVEDPTKQPEGIITVLQTVSQKFSEMVADTKAQEATDQETFDDEKKASTIELARLRQESEELTEQKRRAISNLQSESSSAKHVQKELDAWNQYQTDLKPACVDGDSSYDERKAARTKEIDALRKAEDFLKSAFDEPESGKFLQIRAHMH